MTVICIIQARMGSTRFPGKVLALLGSKPVIGHVYERCREAIPRTVVAIPASPENDPLADYLKTINAPVFRWDGPENDVLGRYVACFVACLKVHPADWVVRVTGDCPLVEPAVIRGLVKRAQDTGAMYVSNVYPERGVPSGFDVEVMHRAALEQAADAASTPEEREHVTPWIQDNFCPRERVRGVLPYDNRNIRMDPPLPLRSVSIDTPADLERVRALVGKQ